jgi:hypothetical protein
MTGVWITGDYSAGTSHISFTVEVQKGKQIADCSYSFHPPLFPNVRGLFL